MKHRLVIYSLVGAWFLLLNGCQSESKKLPEDQPLVQDQYRLKEDREAFAEIRKNVPEDRQKQNDERALILYMMSDLNRSPGEIREKFDSIVTKKRDVFQKNMDQRREEYVKKERKDRESFTKTAETDRKKFTDGKHSSDEKSEFFADQDTRRRDFYSNQREKRDEFEADVRDQRKNFDDYIRQKTMEFNQDHRAYTKRYETYQKENQTQH